MPSGKQFHPGLQMLQLPMNNRGKGLKILTPALPAPSPSNCVSTLSLPAAMHVVRSSRPSPSVWHFHSYDEGLNPYKNDKVAQACDMVVTSLYTRNMPSTTSFPGYDNLETRLSVCFQVVTTWWQTGIFAQGCDKLSQDPTQVWDKLTAAKPVFFYAVVVVTRYLHVTCMFHTSCVLVWKTCMQHTCNIHVTYMFPGQYRHATCTVCATCVLNVLRACSMHVLYELLIHVAIFFALPYNYNIFMIRVCPVWCSEHLPSYHILGVGENQAVSW